MQTILDTIFSIVIGGLIITSLHSLNRNLSNAAVSKTVTTGIQENVSVMTDILEYDLRKIGYNNRSAPNFVLAESSRIHFRADLNNDGGLDSVFYYLGSTADASQINPRSRVLYRSYNAGAPQPIRLGITRLRFWYYSRTGAPLAATPAVSNPAQIATIRTAVSMSVGTVIEPKKLPNGTVKYDTSFSAASWERTVKPVNIR